MAFSINTNVASMIANMHANSASNTLGNSLSHMSSGSYFSSAAYNASGLGIADQLSAQVSGLGQAIQNSNDTIGMLQVADGAMSGINENMQRIRTLTLQASNGTMSDSNRAIIQKEIDALMASSDDIAKNTSYNDINLLDGSGGSSSDGTFVAQTGAYQGDTKSISIGDAQVATLVGSIDVTTQAGRDTALDTIDNAMTKINDIRSDLGATQNALSSNIRNISLTQVNVAAAESQMKDVDFALESANFSKANIMSQVGSFAQAQANARGGNLVGLLS